ncbi:restriction endonuclease subunit S [bacterium]|nr:restriction endonuclease subunit S [bacterium]
MTFPKVGYLMRAIATSSTIKNTVELEHEEGLYPGYSASGQDVWLPYFDYDGPAIVLSAVGAQCGKTFLADGKWGTVANTTAFAIDKNKASPKFLHYMTNQKDFWEKGGSAQPYVKVSETLRKRFFIPDLATQRQVADFLDRETARIDLLIEKKQRLVALLSDHWDRFTFDLFSLDTPTRFELDKSEWQHQKLKFLSPQVTVGIVVTPAAYYTDDGVPAIRGTNIRAMDLRLDDMVSITDEGHRINKKSAVAEGDVVVVRTGQPGTAAVVPKTLDGANCIDVILIKKSKKYDSHLLAHFLNSSAAKAQYSSGSSGAIQQHFNISIASNLVIPVPPSHEQDRVLAILKQEGQRVRNLTTVLQSSIDRLKEYRSALITAAVTGQIDVTTYAKSGTPDRRLDAIQEEIGA